VASRFRTSGALALACLAAALAVAPLAAQEEGILELRLTAVAERRTVGMFVDGRGEPLVPLLQVAAFLEIPVEVRADTLLLQWPPAAWNTRIDLGRREVVSEGTRFVAAADEWLQRGEEVFVSVGVLGRILAGEARVDWENLGLVIAGRDDYPIVVRLRNLARRERVGHTSRRPVYEPDVPYPVRSGGAAGTWGLSGAYGGGSTHGSARAALGLALLGGSLEGGGGARMANEPRLSDPHVRYARAFPAGHWIRQLELGDVRGDALVTRPFFGVALTNAPLYAPHHFGEALINPLVPAGWEVEVYQGEYLLGVSTAGSTEPIAAPIGYGTTPLRLRMVGPAGQERTEELVFLVPAVQVPPGEWRYHLGGGACRVSGCTAFGYADVRHGVARNLTLGLGVDHTERDTTGATRPYGIVSMNPRPDVRVELRARAGALVHGTLQQYRRHGGWRLSSGWRREEGIHALAQPMWFGEGGGAFRLGPSGRGQQVGFQGRLRGRSPTAPDQWQAGLTSGYRRTQFGVAYESGFQSEDVLSLSAHTFAPRHLLRGVRDLNLNGRVDLSGGALHGGALTTTFRPAERAVLTAGLGWNARAGVPALSLSVVTRTPSAYLQTNTFSEAGRRGGFASAGGGVALGGAPLVSSPFETIGRGGVRGVVFLDEDGDGMRGPHEPVLDSVPVVIGGERAVSGADGAYHAWGLLPYSVVAVRVDTLNLRATDVSPLRGEHLVRLTPNVYATVDIPLVRTREVIGTLAWRGRPRGLGGITVEAHRAGDPAPHRATTFSDGEFYFQRLPAGVYTLTVAETSLGALGGAAVEAPLHFTVPGTRGTTPLRLSPLEVRPADGRRIPAEQG
jgi:hypothetical protein